MTLRRLSDEMPVGVIGSGSFGTVMSNLLAMRSDVILYARREEVAERAVRRVDARVPRRAVLLPVRPRRRGRHAVLRGARVRDGRQRRHREVQQRDDERQ